MKFNRCVRCGSFYTTEDAVCPNCISKDEMEKDKLKRFLANNEIPKNPMDLSCQSGISMKNINRYLDTKDFSSLKKFFNKV